MKQVVHKHNVAEEYNGLSGFHLTYLAGDSEAGTVLKDIMLIKCS